VLGPEEIMKLPLSNNAAGAGIEETSEDIKRGVSENMHTDEKFSLKTDETTDAAGKPQLIPA
jgi:hypothetical protein